MKEQIYTYIGFFFKFYYKIKTIINNSNKYDVIGIFLGYIKISGTNNNIRLRGKFRNTKINIVGDSNSVFIEDGRIINLSINIIGDKHTLKIEKHRGIANSKIIMMDNCTSISIDEMTGIGGARIVVGGKNNYIKIGKMNMISDNVEIWASDTHSIIDTTSGNRINYDKPIVIEDHVWIGSGVKILKGTRIEKESIVGMGSIVVNNVPKNSISIGIPNKTIKDNISWKIERN